LVTERLAFACIKGAMSLLTDIGSFAVVAGLLTIVPGLDTAMVLRSAASQGRKHGFATALGVNTGALVRGGGGCSGPVTQVNLRSHPV
jgi:hypothetical protein